MEGYIVHSTYKSDANGVHLKFFGRMKDGKSFLATKTYEPYFYILTKDEKEAKQLEETVRIEETDVTNFDSKPLSKVYCKIPSDVATARHKLKEMGIKCFEADVR